MKAHNFRLNTAQCRSPTTRFRTTETSLQGSQHQDGYVFASGLGMTILAFQLYGEHDLSVKGNLIKQVLIDSYVLSKYVYISKLIFTPITFDRMFFLGLNCI